MYLSVEGMTYSKLFAFYFFQGVATGEIVASYWQMLVGEVRRPIYQLAVECEAIL